MPVDHALAIFPPHGLDQSILASVAIGVLVLLFFTEMFGWVFVGLVVPGYLASVFAIHPAAGTAVCIEAVLTYLLAVFLSEYLCKLSLWSRFFGRERFFVIVLASVLVRQQSQTWLMPELVQLFEQAASLDFFEERDFFSIGLVLVPLTANMFWKVGLLRGTFQTAVCVVITYAFLAFVLLRYTNLSISELELTYEDVAVDFVQSAKAYMILTSGALIAAYCNLRYGWDYNGILIPSLLGLLWFAPLALIVTVGEAIVLYLLTTKILSLPFFPELNLEGPRKVALIFVVGFMMKFTLGWLAAWGLPSLRVTDFFGFGYVLTSLMAVKMMVKKKVAVVVLPTATVSALGFIMGSASGFALEQVFPKEPDLSIAIADDEIEREYSARGWMLWSEARAVVDRPRGQAWLPSGTRLGKFAALMQDASREIEREGRPSALNRERAGELGLRWFSVDEQAWGLAELDLELGEQPGWPVIIQWPKRRGPIIEVPYPHSEAPSAVMAEQLCRRLGCRMLVISGVDGQAHGHREGDSTLDRRSPLQILRTLNEETASLRVRVKSAPSSQLHLKHSLPEGIDFSALAHIKPQIAWTPPTREGWDDRHAPATLVISRETAFETIEQDAAPFDDTAEPPPLGEEPAQRDLTATQGRMYGLLLERLVRRPQNVSALAVDAEAIGLRLYRDRADRLVLMRADGSWSAYGVTLVALGGENYAVEVPGADRDDGIRTLGDHLARKLNARFLFWGAQGQSIALEHFHAVVHRQLSEVYGGPIVQLRGLSLVRSQQDAVIIGVGDPVLTPTQPDASLRDFLVDPRTRAFFPRWRWADGGYDVADLRGQGNRQIAFSRAEGGATTALFWLSPQLRVSFADPGVQRLQALLLSRGWQVLEELPETAADRLRGAITPLLERHARAFATSENPQFLGNLEQARQSDRLVAAIHPDGFLYFVYHDRAGLLRGIVIGAFARDCTNGPRCREMTLQEGDGR